jgi:thiol-disulfide isomerase/thioredoxin
MAVIGLAASGATIRAADAESKASHHRASISGRILGTDGKPMKAVKVVLYAPFYGGNEEVLLTTATDSDGRYSFRGLRGWGYNVLALPKGLAIDGRGVNIDEGEQLTLPEFRLERAVPAAVVIRDSQRKPLAGARLRSLKWTGPSGNAYRLTSFDLNHRLGVPVFVTGTDGRLPLLPLPPGARVTGIVAHPDFAPSAFEIELNNARPLPSIALKKAGFIRIQLSPHKNVAGLGSVQVLTFIRSSALGTPSATSYTFENIPIEGRDQLVLPIEPGCLTFLRLDHPQFTISPQMSDWGSESYRIKAGDTQEFKMTVSAKVAFSGRLLNRETGKPFEGDDVVIWGYIADKGRAAIDEQVGADWALAGSTRTERNGDFSLPLSAGRTKLRFQPRTSIVEPETVELDVRANDQRRIVSLSGRPIPAITGTVVDGVGHPVGSVIVRLQKQFRGTPPIITDRTGQFRFQLPWLPTKMGSDTDLTATIVAFDPLHPLSCRRSLKFDRRTRAADVQDLRLTVAPEPLDAVIDRVAIDEEAIGPGSASQPALIGTPAPELDCQAWLNDRQNPERGRSHRLADFRGKYVLLDFWNTGCGPCHYDFPTIKRLGDLYRDRNFVVIGVHDNSADLQSVRAHVASQKIDFLIAVDQPDGRTLRAYERFVSFGFPTYVLIDPNGLVLKTTADPGEPRIRPQMFEIVRQNVLRGDALQHDRH